MKVTRLLWLQREESERTEGPRNRIAAQKTPPDIGLKSYKKNLKECGSRKESSEV